MQVQMYHTLREYSVQSDQKYHNAKQTLAYQMGESHIAIQHEGEVMLLLMELAYVK